MAESAVLPRTITLVRPPNRTGVGVFCIAGGGKSQFYTFKEIPCAIGGRGFAVHRLGQGNLYHVRVSGPEDSSCECMGFLRWGRCKHVAGLAALIRGGTLDIPNEPRRVGECPTAPRG